MNKGQAFAEFARGRYAAGREISFALCRNSRRSICSVAASSCALPRLLVLEKQSTTSSSSVVCNCRHGLNVCLIEFTPTVAALDVYNTNTGQAPITNVFTSANRARMSVTPDCLSTLDCVIWPKLIEAFLGLNAYTILPSKDPPLEAGDYFIQWVVAHTGPGPMPLGSNITILEPLQLVLLSS